jgi:hypothetical protein
MNTLADITAATGFGVLEHLEADAAVPVLDGLQAQGDLLIVPATLRLRAKAGTPAGIVQVPADGIAVIEATTAGGHEHRLFAGTPGTAYWLPAPGTGQDIGTLECAAPAWLLHPEHGATAMAPGTYRLRRQREQADAERLVAD